MHYTSYTKVSADFRRIARGVLKGKWKIAVLAGFLASLLFALDELNISIDTETADLLNTIGIVNPSYANLFFKLAAVVTVVSIVAMVLRLALGGIISIGYAKFNLNLLDGAPATVGDLFAYFSYWKNAIIARLVSTVIITLFSILFVIPGIIASLSLAMVPYILAENPDMKAIDALKLSKNIMDGNRWRLFCLQFSFIGWHLLASLTLGIGYLWLTPYMHASYTAFFRDITVTEPVNPPEDEAGIAAE